MSGRLRCRRPGFTLIELGVGWVVIAVLAALLLPAVQATREAARRSQCQDHLHNLVIAMHNYEGAFKMIPPGSCDGWGKSPESRYSWGVFILPFIEQKPLYDEFANRRATKTEEGLPDPATRQVFWNVDVDLYRCPSDTLPRDRAQAPALLSYKGNVGDLLNDNNEQTRGVFGYRSFTRFAHITDGTSNTLAFGEMVIGQEAPTNVPGGVALKVNGETPDACWERREEQGRTVRLTGDVRDPRAYPGGHAWDGRAYYAFFATVIGPNGPSCQSSDSDTAWGHLTASSRHPGGSQVGLADGKVVFISQSIDSGNPAVNAPSGKDARGPSPFGVWGKLGSRAGGEPVRIP
jgi:hypothetical protein